MDIGRTSPTAVGVLAKGDGVASDEISVTAGGGVTVAGAIGESRVGVDGEISSSVASHPMPAIARRDTRSGSTNALLKGVLSKLIDFKNLLSERLPPGVYERPIRVLPDPTITRPTPFIVSDESKTTA